MGLRNSGPLRIDFSGGKYRFTRAHLLGPSSDLVLRGGGAVGGDLAASVTAKTELAALKTLFPSIRSAEGTLDVEVQLSGPTNDPAVIGSTTLKNAALAFEGFPEPIRNLDGRLAFSSRRVVVESFSGDFAGGRFRVGGDAAIRDLSLERFDLTIEGDQFVLRPAPGVEVSGDTRLALRWRDGQRLPKLHGTIDLERVLYSRPMVLLQNLSLGELSKKNKTTSARYSPEHDRVELDVRVRARDNLRVANNVVDAEIRIEDDEQPFRIVGTDQRYGAVGALGIPRGTFVFRNANFDIRRGRVDFSDQTRIAPNFNVEAQTEIRRTTGLGPSWRILLRAFGTSETFRLETSSEPALSQEDIVLLLTMGMTRAEADQLQTGDLTGTAALEALATVTGINREVRRAVPIIDDFQISSQYSPITNQPEPKVSIGKRLNDRLRLSASTGLGDSRQIRTALEWRLSDKTSLQTAYDNINAETASSLGNIGLDIRWRLEFK